MQIDLLTQKQRTQMIEIIKEQCRHFQNFEREYDALFYEPYTQMRHKHTATSAVLSGFAPGKFKIEGITSTDLNYGLNDKLVQPELHCEKGIFHIYSNGSDLKVRRLFELCSTMNTDTSSTPVFFIVLVYMDNKGALSQIELCLPNSLGTIIERECIYKHHNVVALTA